MQSDAQLLCEYAEHGSETAFAEIVTRHTNLVYSAALRQTGSPESAAEIAQTVFISLAHSARSLSGRLAENAPLAGWLCRSVRNISLNLRRDEFRRHSRERKAMEDLNSMPDTTPDWGRLRPVLDEAMSGLSEADYDALVLRFFKNQDLRSVGLALGLSDDAAQKRVSRALDKLREHLSRRGITPSAAALSMALSVSAVHAAPAGLAATISTVAVAGTAGQVSAALVATKTIAMTTLQKTLIGAILAVTVGTGLYKTSQASRLREQNRTVAEQIQQVTRERDDAMTTLGKLRQENERLRGNTADLARLQGEVARLRNDSMELGRLRAANAALAGARNGADPAVADPRLNRVDQLKQRLEQTPNAKIPEFQLLTEDDWLYAVESALQTDKDYRKAFGQLRNKGENKFLLSMQSALQEYLKASRGQFPTAVSQLRPFFKTDPDDAMLQRYDIMPASLLELIWDIHVDGDSIITVKKSVDEEYDTFWYLAANGFGNTSYQGSYEMAALAPALMAYMAQNNGQKPKAHADLLPYLTTPEQRAAYRKLEEMRRPK